jgi:hypothetical protein
MVFRIVGFIVAAVALFILWVLLRAASSASRWEDQWTGKPNGRRD